MEYLQCKIKPKASFHIGIKEGSLEKTMHYIHSDTIFSGICNAYRLLYGKDETESLLEKFKNEQPSFLISSAFPYIDDIVFFPMPKFINFSDYVKDEKLFKKSKKIEFVSEEIIKGISKNRFKEELKEENMVQGKILVTGKESEKIKNASIWKEKEVARVVIDRKTNASNIYYFGEVEYCDKCGLHFLIKFMENGIRNKIEAAIRLLGDEGIGGDRSYGKGLFEAEFNNFEWSIKEGKFMNLSLYLPKENEIEMVKKGWYEIVNRGGWVYSPDKKGERKKFVRMIKEGSTFEGDEAFYGRITEIGTSEEYHHVYRYGYGMPLYFGGGA